MASEDLPDSPHLAVWLVAVVFDSFIQPRPPPSRHAVPPYGIVHPSSQSRVNLVPSAKLYSRAASKSFPRRAVYLHAKANHMSTYTPKVDCMSTYAPKVTPFPAVPYTCTLPCAKSWAPDRISPPRRMELANFRAERHANISREKWVPDWCTFLKM